MQIAKVENNKKTTVETTYSKQRIKVECRSGNADITEGTDSTMNFAAACRYIRNVPQQRLNTLISI